MLETGDIALQIQQKWMLFWIGCCLSVIVLSIAWRKGFFSSFQVSFLPVIKGKDVLRGFIYFVFVAIFLVPLLLKLVFDFLDLNLEHLLYSNPQIKNLFNLFVMLGSFSAVLVAYLQLQSSQRQKLWRQNDQPWYEHVKIGIAAWFVSYPLLLAFSQWISIVAWNLFHHFYIEQVAVQNLRRTLESPTLFILSGLTVVILVPLTEEFLFRGLLQTWLKGKFRQATFPIILSSIIFSLFHYSGTQGITNIELLSSLFLLSCMLGYVYERQHSLWASIGLHSFFNFMSLLMLIADSLTV